MSSTRFISQYPGYIFQVRPQRQRSLGDGSVEITQEAIYAKFRPLNEGAFIFENEETLARKHFKFPGNTQEMDLATPSDPINRLAIYDTEEAVERGDFQPEEKELVERRLSDTALTTPSDVMLITTHPIEAPFPRYDTYTGDPEELAARLLGDGFDLAQVLHYERTFGQKRPEFVSALETMIALEEETTVNA